MYLRFITDTTIIAPQICNIKFIYDKKNKKKLPYIPLIICALRNNLYFYGQKKQKYCCREKKKY